MTRYILAIAVALVSGAAVISAQSALANTPLSGSSLTILGATPDDGHVPANTLDGSLDPESRWSSDSEPAWIVYGLGDLKVVTGMEIAWYRGTKRKAYFEVHVSHDGKLWRRIVRKASTSGKTNDFQMVELAYPVAADRVRIVGLANEENEWTSITEVKIHTTADQCFPEMPDTPPMDPGAPPPGPVVPPPGPVAPPPMDPIAPPPVTDPVAPPPGPVTPPIGGPITPPPMDPVTPPMDPVTPPTIPDNPAPSACSTVAPAIESETNGNLQLDTVLAGLQRPWGGTASPDGRIFITEKAGGLKAFNVMTGETTPITGGPTLAGDRDMMFDVLLHPNFATNNMLYLNYAMGNEVHISSYVLSGNALTNAQMLFHTDIGTPASGGEGSHYGSRMAFGSDGKIYITLGDRHDPAQAGDPNTFHGTIARLNEDGTVPADNPFVGGGGKPEVYSYGHRHPQGIAVHPATGTLVNAEHGPSGEAADGSRGGDELNCPEPNGNFGWPASHHDTVAAGTVAPVHFWGTRDGTGTIAPSGIEFYTGDLFPEWKNDLFIGGVYGYLVRVRMNACTLVEEEKVMELGRVREVINGPCGHLYYFRDAATADLIRISPVGTRSGTPPPADPPANPAPPPPADEVPPPAGPMPPPMNPMPPADPVTPPVDPAPPANPTLACTAIAEPLSSNTENTDKGAVTVDSVASGLSRPWGVTATPDGHLLITEKGGTLKMFNAMTGDMSTISGVPGVDSNGQGGLLDVLPHPNYATNKVIYLSYSEGGEMNIMRGTLSGTALSGQVIFRTDMGDGDPNHYGGRLVFGGDGKLYASFGERHNKEAADTANAYNGTIVRLNEDGSIPADNPTFTGGSKPGVYSFGHRNPQGLGVQPGSGQLFNAEHGPSGEARDGSAGGDEVNCVQAGGDYGWARAHHGEESGGQIQSLRFWGDKSGGGTIAPSGIAFYTGDKVPAWKDDLFIAALYGHVRRLKMNGCSIVEEEVMLDNYGRIRDVATGPCGYLYFIPDQGDTLYRVGQ